MRGKTTTLSENEFGDSWLMNRRKKRGTRKITQKRNEKFHQLIHGCLVFLLHSIPKIIAKVFRSSENVSQKLNGN